VWYADQLRARGIAVAAAVVNRVHPRFGSGTADDAAGRASRETDPAVAALWTNLADLRTIGEREREALAPLDDRLDGASLVEVPLLAGDVHDLDGLVEIGNHLFKGPRSVPAPGHR
jgi:hypothetical protein